MTYIYIYLHVCVYMRQTWKQLPGPLSLKYPCSTAGWSAKAAASKDGPSTAICPVPTDSLGSTSAASDGFAC